MKDVSRPDLYRAFYVSHEAYYAAALPDKGPEIMLSLAAEGGGTAGEFAIRWIELGGKQCPRLEVFSDAWAALVERFGDLLDWLARHDDPTPEEVKRALVAAGVKDETSYVGPQGEEGVGAPFAERVAALQRLARSGGRDGALVAPIARDLARRIL